MSITLKPLDQQVMLITGASSGIGLVTAKAAAAKGASVMLVARNEAALQQAVAEIEAAGGTADYAVADVGIAADVEAAADKAVQRFGRIDTWVNNAGVAIYAKLADTPLDEHEQLFRTNYFGVVNGATAAVRHLQGNGGALITVASIAADIPTPIMGAYAASKHAVKGYMESLRIELNGDKAPISVTIIKPSGIDTPVAQHAANHGDGEAVIPPLVYDPSLVADAILHAAVHPSRDITVGGAGRAQVLVGTHFPTLLDKLGPLMMPALFDRKRPKTPGDTLFVSEEAGRERSGTTPGKKFSLYTSSVLHPGMAAVVGIAATAGLFGLVVTHRLTQRR
ncbi:SDR family oxidoreductase [Glacieibacterium sp.]|uniref:SDR family oxidoreductase n=1 Tax=Glacieibacterium sp. TaxID=2860237 RepID=UPI003AFFFA2E